MFSPSIRISQLLYRATIDGFNASSFHSKCDNKSRTISIIKTTSNYVFGGYTNATWDGDGVSKTDSTAFIFSLRRNGVSNNQKFMVIDPSTAIEANPYYGPIFGIRADIFIRDRSDVDGGYIRYCTSYQCPPGYSWGDTSRAYLAGSRDDWLVSEIEVYQILD
jgi:hypothetical protein